MAWQLHLNFNTKQSFINWVNTLNILQYRKVNLNGKPATKERSWDISTEMLSERNYSQCFGWLSWECVLFQWAGEKCISYMTVHTWGCRELGLPEALGLRALLTSSRAHWCPETVLVLTHHREISWVKLSRRKHPFFCWLNCQIRWKLP